MKWQPVMLVIEKRLECQCGALAIFVLLDGNEKRGDKEDMDYSAWCQTCWQHAQEESEEQYHGYIRRVGLYLDRPREHVLERATQRYL